MTDIAKGSLKDLIFQIQPACVQCFSLKVSTELSTMFCSAHLQHQTSTSMSAIGNKKFFSLSPLYIFQRDFKKYNFITKTSRILDQKVPAPSDSSAIWIIPFSFTQEASDGVWASRTGQLHVVKREAGWGQTSREFEM